MSDNMCSICNKLSYRLLIDDIKYCNDCGCNAFNAFERGSVHTIVIRGIGSLSKMVEVRDVIKQG